MPEKQRFSLKFSEMLKQLTEMNRGFSGMQVYRKTIGNDWIILNICRIEFAHLRINFS